MEKKNFSHIWSLQIRYNGLKSINWKWKKRMGSFPQMFFFFFLKIVLYSHKQSWQPDLSSKSTYSVRRWAPLPQSHSLTYIYGSMDIHINIKLLKRFLIHSCRICHRPENSSTLASFSLSFFSFFHCHGYKFSTSPLQSIIVRTAFKKRPPLFYDVREHDKVQALLYFHQCGHDGASNSSVSAKEGY